MSSKKIADHIQWSLMVMLEYDVLPEVTAGADLCFVGPFHCYSFQIHTNYLTVVSVAEADG